MGTRVTDKTTSGRQGGLGAILVSRGTPGMTFHQPIDKIGFRTNRNNWIEFENCRVPEENAFAFEDGDLIISKAFTWSGPVAGIGAVGVARAAYEWALQWSKTFTSLGDRPIIHYQKSATCLSISLCVSKPVATCVGKLLIISTYTILRATPWAQCRKCFRVSLCSIPSSSACRC